ncbi:NLR family CARD domain-containing protein 3 [Linum perenne]
MARPPSLESLIFESIKRKLVRGENDDCIYEVPEHLFEALIAKLPPVGLQNLQYNMPFEDSDDYEVVSQTNGRKRWRCGRFDKAWEALFKLRWPILFEAIQVDDWQQMYWQTHLQNCLNEAAQSAVLPSFDGRIAEIRISERTLECIGYEEPTENQQISKLSYHCREFGLYARSLQLQSVFCDAETCELLQNSKLQSLVLRWVRTQKQVGGLCELLVQNSETLTSIEFIHSQLSPTFIDALCSAININGIQEFAISASGFIETNSVSLPHGLISILSSGRSLCLLKFHGDHLDHKFASLLFHTLVDGCSSLATLDLSDNNIAGWLSSFNWRGFRKLQSSLGMNRFPQSLRVLNIRANNLQEEDMVCLRHALVYMPNLEVLDISDNPIEDDGVRCLVPYFAEASKGCFSLVELKLDNCELSCNGAIELLDTLSNLKKPLNSLSIADNSLGSRMAETFGKFLGTNVKVLNIEGIGLGSFGFRELQERITTKLNLVEINISKNRGGLETARFVCNLLSLAPEITRINAAYNLMQEESLSLIFSALKATTGSLECLDLTGNFWDYQTHLPSFLSKFEHNGRPILILPSPHAHSVLHDDDP